MNDTVWSVNILLIFGLITVLYFLYYILTLDQNEEKTSSHSNPNETFDK
jgi:hypothetical protein